MTRVTNDLTILFEPGADIFREGDIGTVAYIILGGEVELSQEADGDVIVFDTLREGDLFGEMALLDRAPRSATARAVGRTKLAVVSREELEELVADTPPAIQKMMRVLMHRLRHQTTAATALTHVSVRSRFVPPPMYAGPPSPRSADHSFISELGATLRRLSGAGHGGEARRAAI